MSIAVLTQVYEETRRLAIAGSVVAGGDFRLKKLLAPLEQAGARAPVFAKVADAVKAVVAGDERNSARALLELTTLVHAVLYTQGQTGAAGKLKPIETTDLGAPTTQTSARVLKPLIDALTTTGSGRLELIRAAHERGAFRDLRLVKPAVDALGDSYAEIADFIADNVLPIYGKAIVPLLRDNLDVHGRGAHARRLRLWHTLDPAGARAVVERALQEGSKEMKVAAIECLGENAADLPYLLEQASAKSQEVRQAAYRALSAIDEDAAVAALREALTGKDLELAADSLRKSRNAKLLRHVLAAAEVEVAGLARAESKKEVSAKVNRLRSLLGCLHGRQDRDTTRFVLTLFQRRGELAKFKGDAVSGNDLNATVVALMEHGTPELKTALATAHATLEPAELASSFRAARQALPADQVFALFSPYLTATVNEKKKQRDPAWARRDALFAALGAQAGYYWPHGDEGQPPLDPRWLDVAVQLRHLSLVRQLARAGHAGANAFLGEMQATVFKSSRHLADCYEICAAMIAAAHPEAVDAVVAALEKHGKSGDYHVQWFLRAIPELPASAVPRLEALVATFGDKAADGLLDYIQQLRDKK